MGLLSYFVWLRISYGVWNPKAQYWGAAAATAYTPSASLPVFLSYFFGYFFDQREGIVFLAPCHLLVFVGSIACAVRFRRWLKPCFVLVAPAVLYVALWAKTETDGHNNGREFVAVVAALAFLCASGWGWLRDRGVVVVPAFLILVSLAISAYMCFTDENLRESRAT